VPNIQTALHPFPFHITQIRTTLIQFGQPLSSTPLAATPQTVEAESPFIYNRAIYRGSDFGFSLERREDDGSIAPDYSSYVYTAAIATLNGNRDLLQAEITKNNAQGFVDVIFRADQLLLKVPIGKYRFYLIEQKPNGWRGARIWGTWDVVSGKPGP
jgi:hypothetical protein